VVSQEIGGQTDRRTVTEVLRKTMFLCNRQSSLAIPTFSLNPFFTHSQSKRRFDGCPIDYKKTIESNRCTGSNKTNDVNKTNGSGNLHMLITHSHKLMFYPEEENRENGSQLK
jgi:hypothetical protein